MDFVNIHSRTLKTDAYVRATGQQRATWLNLLTYCTTQENSGKIPRAAGWTDLQWLVAVGIHKADSEEACDLWRFTPGGDCVVEFYPLEQERKHQAQREGGAEGNRRRYGRKKPRPLASGDATDSVTCSPTDSVEQTATDSGSDSVKEGKVREGKGMEERVSARSEHGATSATDNATPCGDSDVQDGEQGASTPAAETDGNDSLAEWPAREEWMAAADVQGLPRELALREWNNQERKAPDQRWRNIDRRRLQHHAAFVLDCARQRGEVGLPKKNSRPPAAGAGDNGAAMAAMAAMSANLNAASEYPASLVEAVKP